MDQQVDSFAAGSGETPLSDVVRRARDGDDRALEQLVEHVTPLMAAWAASRLRSERRVDTTCEDLLQEVWLRILPLLPDLRPHPSTPGRWTPALLSLASSILRNVVVDARRRAIRSRLIGDSDREEVGQRAASTSGPVTRAIRSERRGRVQLALERLTERERALFLGRLFDGATIEELAEEHGLSYHAVVKSRQRARRRLEGILAAELLDAFDQL